MKRYNHSYNYGKRLNWRTIILSATIVFCAVLGSHVDDDNVYVRKPGEDQMFMKPIVVEPEPTLEDKIREYFPRNWRTMIAVAHAESQMSMEATGYNCWYVGAKVYAQKVQGAVSKACLPKDRAKAWSVDCFLLQKNYPGRKTCPDGVTIDMHLKEVADLSRAQGLSAWVTYQTGAYKAHLTK